MKRFLDELAQMTILYHLEQVRSSLLYLRNLNSSNEFLRADLFQKYQSYILKIQGVSLSVCVCVPMKRHRFHVIPFKETSVCLYRNNTVYSL